MLQRLFGGGKSKPKDAPDKKFTLENLKNCWAQLAKHSVRFFFFLSLLIFSQVPVLRATP